MFRPDALSADKVIQFSTQLPANFTPRKIGCRLIARVRYEGDSTIYITQLNTIA